MLSAALIRGVALGGGAEIATACDFRVMTDKARIGLVQTRMGVLTGWGGGTRLVRIVGKRNALKILSGAKVMDAQECIRTGLVDDIIPESEGTLDLTKAWLQQYCSIDASLVHKVKRLVTYADEMDLENSLEKERDLFSKTWSGDLHRAAMNKNIKH